ncbi:MAG: hypothetical protein HYY05_00995 [Chloroflexi bacterium]|nr:hypothetical protein [Chloroflexota bacterium]
MNSSVTRQFRQRLARLPSAVREQARQAYALWRSNPFHNSLQFKRVSQRQPIYSIRIGLGYRALAVREEDHLYWFWIGSHAEYDELLGRL